MAGIYNPEVYLPKLPAKDAVTTMAIRPWQVLHACEQVRDLLPVIEGQLAVGMRPYLATPRGAGAAALFLRQVPQPVQTASLLTAWSDVRRWRSSIVDSVPGMEVVHAHLFSAGMAAVQQSLISNTSPTRACRSVRLSRTRHGKQARSDFRACVLTATKAERAQS